MIPFKKFYNNILLEYSNSESKQLATLLSTKYKNRRIALTRAPFEHRPPVRQLTDYPHKPEGIWYALGGDWANFLNSEMPYRWGAYNHAYMLDIDYSSILRINTEEKLKKLEYEYWEYDDGGAISWMKVHDDGGYKGVEIIPLQENMRQDSKNGWYYHWDVASGCIWDTSAIKNAIEITPEFDPNYKDPDDYEEHYD